MEGKHLSCLFDKNEGLSYEMNAYACLYVVEEESTRREKASSVVLESYQSGFA